MEAKELEHLERRTRRAYEWSRARRALLGFSPVLAVLPGVLAGFVPLASTLCAMHVGHVCMGDQCTTVCLPACVVGGLAAGIGVAVVGHRGRHGASFWISASALAMLTGAMGCACIGVSGVLGLGLGFAAGAAPTVVRDWLGPRST